MKQDEQSYKIRRAFRLSYHDDRYTRLTPDTYKAWAEVEEESGIQLVHKTGCIQFAKKGEVDDLLKKYTDSMSNCNISYEVLNGTELHKRFPQFATDDSHIAVYDKDGGLVNSGLGIAVHTQLARAHGATIIENCPVQRIERASDGSIKARYK
ncbi:hypothetical protein KUTeg_019064 [Tegillarca granosa]|uniref:FAD dependent oxidoreductase domain-containing protein n=1 Tax=Tegillarca granosa TaxID=220873 RepID=A0ABQ9EHD5_TEGGR|nr:hypothetical protein KUTeg_019064 [Tegillarca granosa]